MESDRGELITFLGRPALSVALGAACENAVEAKGDRSSGERSHKRSRPPPDSSTDGEEVPGSVQQAVRAMLRAHKLGVLVPLVYHCNVTTGRAVVEAVPGKRLAELIDAAVVEAAGAAAGLEATDAAEAGVKGTAEQAGAEARPEAAGTEAGAGGSGEGEDGGPAAAGTGVAAVTKAAAAEAASAGAADSGPASAALDAAAVALGRTLARLHDGGQVHGGLSGETVLLREGDGAVVLTGFGRSYNTIVPIDKAEDLAGLEAALLAAAEAALDPPEQGQEGRGKRRTSLAAATYEKVVATYRSTSRHWSSVHNKLAEARAKKAAAATSQQHPGKRAKTLPDKTQRSSTKQ